MNKKLLFLPLLVLLFASCEKVVNIDLNNAAPAYVVEGVMYEGIDTLRVHVAKTTDYYGRSPQAQIDNAIVTITGPDGASAPIPFVGNGLYELPGFNGIADNTYSLKVMVDGKEFTAESTVPKPVLFDSISYEFKEEGFLDAGYDITGFITDPASQQNNYRLIYQVNDTLRTEPEYLELFDDKYNNGRTIRVDVFQRFLMGDTVTFELRTMDRPVFDYFTTLNDALNNGNGPAPANPNSNIQGGALGYFGAFSRSKIGVRIR